MPTRHAPILPIVLIVATAALLAADPASAAPAPTRCAQWNLPPSLTIHQSNNWNMGLVGQQQGNVVRGTAESFFIAKRGTFTGSDPVIQKGTFDGKTRGRQVEISIFWNANSVGIYNGKINDRGRIEGSTHDRQHPQQTATWFADELATCAPH